MLNAETVGDLSKNYKSITIPAGKYISDTLGLGADGFEYCLEFNATDSNNEIHYGGIGYSISYTNGGSFLLDDMNYDGSGSDKLNFISLNLHDEASGIIVACDIGRIAGHNISDNLVDRIVSPLYERLIYSQNYF